MTAVDQPDARALPRSSWPTWPPSVETGPVDMGAFTQAEMAVVLGDVPALAGVEEAVLAEAVRSLGRPRGAAPGARAGRCRGRR